MRLTLLSHSAKTIVLTVSLFMLNAFLFAQSTRPTNVVFPGQNLDPNIGLSAATPFTNMGQARALVAEEGIYFFDLGGNTFSTEVTEDGWVLIASNDETLAPQVALTISQAVTPGSNAILSAAACAELTDITELRILASRGTGAGTVDAVSNQTVVLDRLRAFQSFGRRDDIQLGTQWTGMGTAGWNGTSCNTTPTTGGATNFELNRNILHSCGDNTGIHWIPGQPGSVAYLNMTQIGNTGFDLYARAPSPANLQLWLKADAGTVGGDALTSWQDQSGNGRDFVNRGVGPDATLNEMNFNPTLNYTLGEGMTRTDPVDTYVGNASFDAGGSANGEITIIVVAKQNGSGGVLNQYDGDDNFVLVMSKNTTTSIGAGIRAGNAVDVAIADNTPLIATCAISPGANNVDLYANGGNLQEGTTQVRGVSTNDQEIVIGGFGAGNNTFAGDFCEVLIFDTKLTVPELDKIESYLAIKYGITMPTNYVSANGNVLWDLATNAPYNNDIAGIGADNCSDLDQRKTKSVNTGSILTVDKTAAFAADAQYLL